MRIVKNIPNITNTLHYTTQTISKQNAHTLPPKQRTRLLLNYKTNLPRHQNSPYIIHNANRCGLVAIWQIVAVSVAVQLRPVDCVHRRLRRSHICTCMCTCKCNCKCNCKCDRTSQNTGRLRFASVADIYTGLLMC